MPINKSKLNARFCSKKSSSGFTLIEIMVSLLVLSIGLLGMVALQNVALRHNQSAYYESQAAFLANDMLDRIRANQNTGAYGIALGSNIPAFGTNCEAALCAPGAMAQWDLNQWRTSVTVTSKLPQAASAVVFSGVNDVAITIRYSDDRDPNLPTQLWRSFTLRAQI